MHAPRFDIQLPLALRKTATKTRRDGAMKGV